MKAKRKVLMLASCLSSVLILAGCGGDGSNSSSDGTVARTPLAPTPHETAAELASERRAAGRAASFVEPEIDNSVPTYGTEAGTKERGEAEKRLGAYLQARQAEEWSAACGYLAASVQRGFAQLVKPSAEDKASDCAATLRKLSKGVDLTDPLVAGLVSLRVQGSNGFALFYGPGHRQYIVPMHREGGAWHPTQSGPIAYPPAAEPIPGEP